MKLCGTTTPKGETSNESSIGSENLGKFNFVNTIKSIHIQDSDRNLDMDNEVIYDLHRVLQKYK
jgi:hypothetical protein